MIIPSFQQTWKGGKNTSPRIYALEISEPDNPSSPPVAWLLVERVETYRFDERDKSVYEATIELFFAVPEPRHANGSRTRASFSASYHSAGYNGPTVSLTSHLLGSGAVFLDPPSIRGLRVGTYLMNEIVLWAQQWPEATVQSVRLLEGQADDENRARRNRFYEQFGLVFEYTDEDHHEGLSKPMPVSSLTPVDTWKGTLRVRLLDEFIGDLLFEQSNFAGELRYQQSAYRQLWDERSRARDRPVRWALQVLWSKHVSNVTLTAILVCFGLLVWWRWPT